MTDKTRIVIADDHPIFLAGLRNLLAAEPEFEVIGEASDGLGACEIILARKPDIAVVDIAMPDLNGIALSRRVLESCPLLRVLVLSLHEDIPHVQRAFAAGARGYLLKRSAAESLFTAIRAVLRGEQFLDPAIKSRSLNVQPDGISSQSDASSLTDRELNVLKLVAHGFTNKEISSQLNVSVKSVETYRARGAEKLGLTTRADIVRFATAQGWFAAA